MRKSYYTGAKRASGLHDLLSHHHRPNGKHIQVPVGNISQVKVEKVDWADQVPAFSAWWALQFLLNNRDVATFLTLRAVTLKDRQSSSKVDAWAEVITERSQKEMVFRDAHFLRRPIEMNKPSIPGWYCSVWVRYFWRALMGHSKLILIATNEVV